jgi:AraC family transcriptional regulator
MNSSDSSLLQTESSRFEVIPHALEGDGYIPVCDNSDILASLLATARVALDSDRRVTQRCIQRAAALLGIDLRSAGISKAKRSYPQVGLASWQVRRLRSYMDGRLDSTIRVSDLAGVLRLSTSHFSRAFRKTFGAPPLVYITRRRMLRAQELMSTTQTSLAQVALECGMCDQAHLSRTFRRVVGINPTTWRRLFLSSASSGNNVSEAGGIHDPRALKEHAT